MSQHSLLTRTADHLGWSTRSPEPAQLVAEAEVGCYYLGLTVYFHFAFLVDYGDSGSSRHLG